MENNPKKVSLEALEKLDDRTLISRCLKDEDTNSLCRNEDFWEQRAINKYGRRAAFYKPEEKTWRNYYLQIITDVNDFKPWNFFHEIISWDIEDFPDMDNIEIYEYKWSETWQNRFHFLNLGNQIILTLKLNYWGDVEYEEEVVSKTYISPQDLLEKIYYFYQEPIDIEAFETLLAQSSPFAEKFTIKDVQQERVKRINMFGNLKFLKFKKLDDNTYEVIIEDDFYTKQHEMTENLFK